MKGRVLGGRYALEKRIGEGGMGVVYKARDRVTAETVAVKIIRSDISCEARAVQRFFREAKAAASLSHEGIVRVLDEGTDVEHYIVMEFVEGVTIREWVRTFGRAPRTLVPLLGDILQALGHAHSRGIIHRDIKPENIIVTPERRAKLMDFGLARPMNVRGVTITQEGAVVGTVAYMSPEQASGKRGDERSDLYSLGVVAYELFSGKRPFSSDSPMNVLIKHIQEDPTPPRRHNPGLPQAIEDVILQLLAKRPEERFPNAQIAHQAFKVAMDQPVPLKRPKLFTQPPTSPFPEDGPSTEVAQAAAPPAEPPKPRRLPARRPMLPGGVLPARRVPDGRPEPEPLIEVAVLYTRMQALQELLDDELLDKAGEALDEYKRYVEGAASLAKGRVLESAGSTQVLLFDGTMVTNPVSAALYAVKLMKQFGGEGSAELGGNGHPFLAAGIYTAHVRPTKDGSVEDSARRDVLAAAKRMHDFSASERKYCIMCEASWERVKEEVKTTVAPFKKLFLGGRMQQMQLYELAGSVQGGGRQVGVAG